MKSEDASEREDDARRGIQRKRLDEGACRSRSMSGMQTRSPRARTRGRTIGRPLSRPTTSLIRTQRRSASAEILLCIMLAASRTKMISSET